MLKRIIRSKVFGIVLFLAVAAGAVTLGINKFHSDQIAAKIPASHVTVLTADNAQTVLSANKPVLLVFCTSDVCKMEQSQLEALAVSSQDAIVVATIDVQAQPKVAQALLTSVNKAAGKNVPVAFPLYVVVDAQGSVANVTLGLMSAQSLEQFVLQSLMPAAPTTTPGTVTTNPSAAPSTAPTK